jgi:uncharacterized Zn finger protein (UPF0148 family)
MQAQEPDCVVCLDAPATTIVSPCGHKSMCRACGEALVRSHQGPGKGTCPVCRAPIRDLIFKVYGGDEGDGVRQLAIQAELEAERAARLREVKQHTHAHACTHT